MPGIFDQEKVWEMALKAERRESREEGLKEGLEKGLEKEAAACLAGYGRCNAGLSREGDSRES